MKRHKAEELHSDNDLPVAKENSSEVLLKVPAPAVTVTT